MSRAKQVSHLHIVLRWRLLIIRVQELQPDSENHWAAILVVFESWACRVFRLFISIVRCVNHRNWKQAKNWGFGHSRFKEYGGGEYGQRWAGFTLALRFLVASTDYLRFRIAPILEYAECSECSPPLFDLWITKKWEQATDNWGFEHLRFKKWRWWVWPKVAGFALEYCTMVTRTDYQGLEMLQYFNRSFRTFVAIVRFVNSENGKQAKNWRFGYLRFKEWRWWVWPKVAGFALAYCVILTPTDNQVLGIALILEHPECLECSFH